MNASKDRDLPASTLARRIPWGRALVLAVGLIASGPGCTRTSVDQALSSDANGFVCVKCAAKFYLPSDVFPAHCPQCKAPEIEMVMGYVCAADQHVTIGPRSKRGSPCEQCGKVASALSLPREADLKTWGATRKSNADVN